MPKLIIIAGPNGSGKSTNADRILSQMGVSCSCFDYDKEMWSIYYRSPDHEFREAESRLKANILFEQEIRKAIAEKRDFSYETNFTGEDPLWVSELFKSSGYKTDFHFVTLPSVEMAQKRVTERVDKGGHFVSDSEIEHRYTKGLENLNKHFYKFDTCRIYRYAEGEGQKFIEPLGCLYLEKGIIKERVNDLGKLSEKFKPILDWNSGQRNEMRF